MKYLIRVAFTVLSLATITPVANAAVTHQSAPVVQQSAEFWGNA
jgi:hypothetical protein